MCGIFATNGGSLYRNIELLKGLEYRGYDSTGFVYVTKDGYVGTEKSVGNVTKLMLSFKDPDAEIIAFMGHTRWATHGKVNKENAHPHFDKSGRYAIVQNGIVENYLDLKKDYNLVDLKSDTDTEVLINVIASKCYKLTLPEAIAETFKEVRGANSIIVLDVENPEEFYMLERGSRLDCFCEEDEDRKRYTNDDERCIKQVYISSGLLDNPNKCKYGFYLSFGGDNKMARICNDIKAESQSSIKKSLAMSDDDKGIPDKGDYDTYMLKEIYEQPKAVEDLLRGRVRDNDVIFGGLSKRKWSKLNSISMLACGSSLHACKFGQMYIEDLARIRVHVEQAAEFRYRNPVINIGTEIDPDDHTGRRINSLNELYVFASQSGETADVLEALSYVGQQYSGMDELGICNCPGSTLAEKTWNGIYTRAGVEVGVASTKAYTNQVVTMLLLAKYLQCRGWEEMHSYSSRREDELLTEIQQIPNMIQHVLDDKKMHKYIKSAAQRIAEKKSCMFLGRGYNCHTASEGALKMKELAYIHAEGYSAAEMKHGPLALISEDMPTVAFSSSDDQYEKTQNNLFEILCRGGKITLITDKKMDDLDVDQIIVPKCSKYISPIIFNVISQLLAYETAIILGKNVDQPRNLAKSVTVE